MGELLEHVGNWTGSKDKPVPDVDAAFDDSIRGGSVHLDPSFMRWRILVREQRACDWCGRPTVTYQIPGDPQPGARACTPTHSRKIGKARRWDQHAFEKEQRRRRAAARAEAIASAAALSAADAALLAAQAHERRMLDPAWRAANCPRPDKLVWLTREGAGMQLADMLGKPWFTNTETLTVYECVCGGFHVGNDPRLRDA